MRKLQKVKAEGRLEGKHWDLSLSTDLEAAYYKWLTAPEPTGLRHLGIDPKAECILRPSRPINTIVVHFPTTVAWSYWQTPGIRPGTVAKDQTYCPLPSQAQSDGPVDEG